MGSYGRFNRDDVNCLLDEYGEYDEYDECDYNELTGQANREERIVCFDQQDHDQQDHDQQDHDQQDHDQSTGPS